MRKTKQQRTIQACHDEAVSGLEETKQNNACEVVSEVTLNVLSKNGKNVEGVCRPK